MQKIRNTQEAVVYPSDILINCLTNTYKTGVNAFRNISGQISQIYYF